MQHALLIVKAENEDILVPQKNQDCGSDVKIIRIQIQVDITLSPTSKFKHKNKQICHPCCQKLGGSEFFCRIHILKKRELL